MAKQLPVVTAAQRLKDIVPKSLVRKLKKIYAQDSKRMAKPSYRRIFSKNCRKLYDRIFQAAAKLTLILHTFVSVLPIVYLSF